MAEFYIEKSQTVKLPSGRSFRLRRGIHTVPDELADYTSANNYGIKPVEEMTDAEWRALGLKKPLAPVQPVAADPAPKTDDKDA